MTAQEDWAQGLSDHSLAVLLLALSHDLDVVATVSPPAKKWWRAAFVEAARRLSADTATIEEEEER